MKVAVLGGGQLARMLALEGIPLGYRFLFLEPNPDPPAGEVGEVIVAGYDDAGALARLASEADVVTYEFENVPVEGVATLQSTVPVHPAPVALEMAQDRLAEKRGFQEAGIDTAPFHPIDGPEDVAAAIEAVGLPAVLKTRRFGYDGKGQAVVRSLEEAGEAVARLGDGLIAESFVAFERELSVLAAAGSDGSRVFYPLTENHHRDGILRVSYAPTDLPPELQARAEALASRVIDRVGYVGVLAIELFQIGGRLLANEMAPRVHNSGHWTLDGAGVSQFENHIRAITGLPLGRPAVPGPVAMVNLIGALPDLNRVARLPGAHLHIYGKSPRPGRKLGHVNVTGETAADVVRTVEALWALLPAPGPLPACEGWY